MFAYHHKVWGVLMLGWVSLYMARIGMTPVLKPIMEEFHLSYAQAGLLASAVFWAYTLMQMPSGFLGDRWGHRRFLLVGTACWTVMCFVTGLVQSYANLILARTLTGMAQGTYFGNDRPIVAHYTPMDQMARGQGISAIGMGLGMGLGILFAGQIAEAWGWRSVFILYSIPSFVAFLLIWRVIREPARPDRLLNDEPAPRYRTTVTNPRLLLLYVSHFTVMYVFWVLGTWAPTIFMDIGVKGLAQSGVYASVLGLIAVPALLGSGALSDKMRTRQDGYFIPLLVSIAALAVLSLAIGLSLDMGVVPVWLSVLLLLTAAAAWGFFPPFYALLTQTVSANIRGTTFGAANTVGFAASLVAPWATGLVKDATRGFSWGFYLCAAICVVGVLSTIGARIVRPSV